MVNLAPASETPWPAMHSHHLVSAMPLVTCTGSGLAMVHTFSVFVIHSFHIAVIHTFHIVVRAASRVVMDSATFFHHRLHDRVVHIHFAVVHGLHAFTIWCFTGFCVFCRVMGKCRCNHQ